ncbi:23S rRNA (guanosine-2'-O-)-methyltransferase RlmB [Candidatus Providencia siddallii]|uniref:23S rRNA (Guanosine-2'-O-)-methyltransferase RlmB n=1 Tax=Candidatus Providencia siddallii TaxID=1715285 RepID=A0A0M6W8B9_9GAMM|nr:23S rRNA (guanosine-2'-O-)-methyltransferase RlmB [Candidatus Providencia siddallii]
MNEIIYGIHTINALLNRSPKRIKEFYYLKERNDCKIISMIQKIKKLYIPIIAVNRQWMDKQTKKAAHQGCIAKILPNKFYKENELINFLKHKQELFLLALDCITDPHNLGACLRSAEAAGIDAVIIPKNKSAQLNAIAKKVACGAAEYIPIFHVTNLVRTLCFLKDNNIRILGTTSEITNNTLYQSNLTGSITIIVGEENKGIRRLTRVHCNELINIPMIGSINSLNVSVATGVCLFEALRQRLYN